MSINDLLSQVRQALRCLYEHAVTKPGDAVHDQLAQLGQTLSDQFNSLVGDACEGQVEVSLTDLIRILTPLVNLRQIGHERKNLGHGLVIDWRALKQIQPGDFRLWLIKEFYKTLRRDFVNDLE